MRIVEKNCIHKNIHKGKPCFIIGNGPSLVGQDLSPLADELTFVVNGFFKHDIVEQWQPTYYFLVDPDYFNGSEPFLQAGSTVTVQEYFDELKNRVYSTTFFVPLGGYSFILNNNLIPLKNTFFVPFQGVLSRYLPDIPDITKSVPGVENVVQMAIMVAMYMGCSPIFLMGLDHDWLANTGINTHFSGESPLAYHCYHCLLNCQLRLWLGYEQLLRVANMRRIRILNATDGGFLDVFERVKYEDVIQEPELCRETKRSISVQSFKEFAEKIDFSSELNRLNAVQAIRQMINKYPDSLNLFLFEATLRFNAGDVDGAKIVLGDIVKRWPAQTNFIMSKFKDLIDL